MSSVLESQNVLILLTKHLYENRSALSKSSENLCNCNQLRCYDSIIIQLKKKKDIYVIST